ncbi:unnamed protein product [Ilex paraguariensis]|uniref:Uncharacterized protein n=1 Tax=Ilex paraguariensis TaxID=185542 RepID=A0ABC8TQI1_9AQUA
MVSRLFGPAQDLRALEFSEVNRVGIQTQFSKIHLLRTPRPTESYHRPTPKVITLSRDIASLYKHTPLTLTFSLTSLFSSYSMSTKVSKKQLSSLEAKNINNSEDPEETENTTLVTTHVFLKPTHSTGTLDKEVVLSRIRHRKRANKFRTAVRALLLSPFAAKTTTDNVSVQQTRWVDDAFAAP